MSDAAEAGQSAIMLRAAQLCGGLLLVWACCHPAAADDEPAQRDAGPENCLKAADLDGRLHRIPAGGGRRGAALVFLSTTCPISNSYLPQLRSAAARCRRNEIDFFGVISDSGISRASAIRHRAAFELDFPVLFDVSGELRRELKATHTPQAIVLSRSGRIIYSGRIDDVYSDLGRKRTSATTHELRDALAALTSGDSVATASTAPVGCLLEDPPVEGGAAPVTFNRDVAPILYANCSGCHRPGEGTPFSLLSYADACQHGAQIAAVTQSRFMPPWHPEPGFGHFQNERRLSDAEIELIRQWVEAGKPEGDPADALAPPDYTDGWRLGQPDLVLTMHEAFELRADGPDIHQHFVLPTGIAKDRLVSAVEFRPGNSSITHHACLYVDNTGAARKLQAREPDVGYGSFVGPGFVNFGTLRSWLPGISPQHLPSGTGQLLPARSDVVLEIHYRPSGKPESDRSVVGIHFAPRTARCRVGELQVMNKALTIPAGAPAHRHVSSFTVPVDTALLDVLPHMHLLGREIKAVATRPDGVQVPLVWIRNWDFNWQDQYLYADPVLLPRGSRIDVEAVFDNSSLNPLNPHVPPQTVRWGEQTYEEMAGCHFRYVCASYDDLATMNNHYVRYAAEQQRVFESDRRP